MKNHDKYQNLLVIKSLIFYDKKLWRAMMIRGPHLIAVNCVHRAPSSGHVLALQNFISRVSQ